MNAGNIPVLKVSGKNLPEVWERSLIETWQRGCEIKTEYDKPEDPTSKDCTMVMVVEDPLSEPRLHRGLPGGLEDLEIYRQEFLDGIHDHWIDCEDPQKWDYTYHERLMAYRRSGGKLNQIEWAIERLAKTPHTRRVLAVTWMVGEDWNVSDPPCLQQIWWRLLPDSEGQLTFNMNTLWRSRDAFKAAFMNMFACTELMRMMAGEIAARREEEIKIGRYVDVSWSYHIYGSYFQEFDRFLSTLSQRTFEERTWTSSFAEPIFAETRDKIKKQLLAEKEGKGKGVI